MDSLFSNFIIGIADIIGMVGVFLIILMYLLLQISKVDPRSIQFSLLNLIGSACILYSLYFNWNLPSLIIEIIWFLISLWGTINAAQRLTKNQAAKNG